ncbi:MAG: diaminopimelate decarboxylase [Desulfobacterales bacterium]|uniref:Diaminopimelate decarboxylase n=1 Tax=Candidatus Desulfatibia vada TaxID=2841696 RepID=A0A8J6NTC6_9BACT|nr:diaminopimelate decarboxylase [Candidatus Desulfatibia vada]MBL6972016.1 diaminopimelate decarboxylase [Desulfobacterales bacterium]
MHHFHYRGNELYCEDVPIQKIAAEVGTPLYLYSHATLKRHFLIFNEAFEGIDRLVCYSAKANTNLALLKLFANLGSGLDIVSGGELYRGLKAGFSPDRIVYSGVGKRVDEIDYALNTGILMFNVESLEELAVINQRAGLLAKKAPVAIRVNPDVDPGTHPYISTGLEKNKFGIDTKTAIEGYKVASRLENIDVVGIDCHIGSQITEAKPFEDALKSLERLITELKALGIKIKYLDMGGGLGITYDAESPPHPREYARAIIDSLQGVDLQLILEPGRVIVGNAGTLITRVLYRKAAPVKEFVITDAGMNDLMRPSLYKAFHAIQPVVKTAHAPIKADVVGPICESGDFLAVDREIPDVKQGDLLAVMSAGAYGFTMSSNYCSRLRVPEVMVADERFYVVRARQTYEDLVAGETIPSFLNS